MPNKDPAIISLRAVRKASHISGKAAKKSGRLLERVEHKTSRMIINKAGSITGEDSISIDNLMHQNFPYMTPIHPALPMVGQKPSVTVFAFLDPKGFYGGIATLLIVAAELANKLGYDLRIAQTTGYSKKTDVLKFLRSKDIDISNDRYSTFDVSYRTPYRYAYLPMHEDDVVVVSAWWDAYVASMLPLKRKFVYLIQDYEPIFYNNSDQQQFADSTYHSGKFVPICNTELMYKFFKKKKYDYIVDNASWFEPAVGNILGPKEPETSKRKLFLYGRPNVHRNLFYSAIKAIDLALASKEAKKYKWEIYCAGQSDIPSIKFSNGLIMKNLGKMDIEAYYNFAKSVDIALSPMLAPHPNYPTLELSSIGAMVVTTSYETKQNLSNYSKNILTAGPSPESMAESIIEAAKYSHEDRISNAQLNSIDSDWNAALEDPISDVVKQLGL